MSSHKYIYVGPYLKLPRLDKATWLDGDRLFRVDCAGGSDIWLANVGKYNLYQDDDHVSGEMAPSPITADMIIVESFIAAFTDEIAVLRELYGDDAIVEFGIVTYWA